MNETYELYKYSGKYSRLQTLNVRIHTLSIYSQTYMVHMYCTMESTCLVLQGCRQLLWEVWWLRPSWHSHKKKHLLFTYIYRKILLKIKISLMTLPLEFLLFLWKRDVLSFKENDITTLIVERGWASDDNNSSFGERPHTNSGTFLTMKTVLKY